MFKAVAKKGGQMLLAAYAGHEIGQSFQSEKIVEKIVEHKIPEKMENIDNRNIYLYITILIIVTIIFITFVVINNNKNKRRRVTVNEI